MLADALLEGWAEDGSAPSVPSDPRTAASVWLAAVRTLVQEQRKGRKEVAYGDPAQGAAAACTVADHLCPACPR